MIKKNKSGIIKSLIPFTIVVFSILIYTGCEENNMSDPTGGSAKIEGRVTNSTGFGKISGTAESVEGAVVTLARINSNGSLETISTGEVTTNSDGRFIIETDSDGESNLVVIARKGDKEWKAIVSSQISSGLTVYSQPLNDETTAEAEIYEEAKAKNYNVHYTDIAAYVNSEVAAEVKHDKNKAGRLASSFHAMADAQQRIVSRSDFGGSSVNWNSIVSASHDAQVQLERDLYYANSNSAVDAAYNSYYESSINAYVNAGLSAEAYSRSLEVSSMIFIRNNSSFDSDFRFHLKKRVSMLRAKVLSFAVQSRFRAIGASDSQVNLAANAGVQLFMSVRNADNENEIQEAFETYNETTVDVLKSALGISGTAYLALEASIQAYKTALAASIVSSNSFDALVNAYVNYYQQIRSSVESAFAGASDAQVNAAVSLIVLLYTNF